jgi:prolyl 4-hydroxylase
MNNIKNIIIIIGIVSLILIYIYNININDKVGNLIIENYSDTHDLRRIFEEYNNEGIQLIDQIIVSSENLEQIPQKTEIKIDSDRINLLIKLIKKNNINNAINIVQDYLTNITDETYNMILNYIKYKPFKIIDNFLSDDECDSIIKFSQYKYSQSQVKGGENNTDDVNDTESRSSKTYYFKYDENDLIKNIRSRIANILNIDKDFLESLQSTKYDKNQYYKLHHDYFTNESNQRKYSVIIYLNDLSPEDGGETYFPFYDAKIIPKKGTMIYFDNSFYNNIENPLTLHESKPILSDKNKFIVTTWSRLNKYI